MILLSVVDQRGEWRVQAHPAGYWRNARQPACNGKVSNCRARNTTIISQYTSTMLAVASANKLPSNTVARSCFMKARIGAAKYSGYSSFKSNVWRGQRKEAFIFSNTEAPGHNCPALSALNGVALVLRCSCRSPASGST